MKPTLTETEKGILAAQEYAVTQKTFWLVWNGISAPTVKHATEKLACAEAHRLSSKQPGDQFVVLKAVGYFRAGPPVPSWTKLK